MQKAIWLSIEWDIGSSETVQNASIEGNVALFPNKSIVKIDKKAVNGVTSQRVSDVRIMKPYWAVHT